MNAYRMHERDLQCRKKRLLLHAAVIRLPIEHNQNLRRNFLWNKATKIHYANYEYKLRLFKIMPEEELVNDKTTDLYITLLTKDIFNLKEKKIAYEHVFSFLYFCNFVISKSPLTI